MLTVSVRRLRTSAPDVPGTSARPFFPSPPCPSPSPFPFPFPFSLSFALCPLPFALVRFDPCAWPGFPRGPPTGAAWLAGPRSSCRRSRPRATASTSVSARRPSTGAIRTVRPQPDRCVSKARTIFVWRAVRGQYNLTVYQLGNSHLHEFIWPYLFRWPGLAVLHDARLHHARAAAHLLRKGAARYRNEFAWNHPDVAPDAAELGVSGFDGSYYYMWPMVRDVVMVSRTTAVHSLGAATELQSACPGEPVEYLTLGEGREIPFSEPERQSARAALGFAPDTVAFGVFGGLTVEKRVPQIIRAFRACLGARPSSRLLLAGNVHPSLDWRRHAREAGIEEAVDPPARSGRLHLRSGGGGR